MTARDEARREADLAKLRCSALLSGARERRRQRALKQ